MDNNLYEAFVHGPHSVMQRRLRPLSLRHLFALLVLNSPLLDNSREIGWSDLEAAVTACTLRNPVKHLHRLHRCRSLRSLLVRLLRPWGLEEHALKFVAYLNDYHSLPESAPEQGGKLAKAPWILRMVHTLCRNGYSENEYWPCRPFRNPLCVWDLPTGEAFFRYAAIQELDGADLDLVDDEERALLAMEPEAKP